MKTFIWFHLVYSSLPCTPLQLRSIYNILQWSVSRPLSKVLNLGPQGWRSCLWCWLLFILLGRIPAAAVWWLTESSSSFSCHCVHLFLWLSLKTALLINVTSGKFKESLLVYCQSLWLDCVTYSFALLRFSIFSIFNLLYPRICFKSRLKLYIALSSVLLDCLLCSTESNTCFYLIHTKPGALGGFIFTLLGPWECGPCSQRELLGYTVHSHISNYNKSK